MAGGYASSRAQERARTLSLQPRVQRKLVPGNALWKRVRDGLQQGLSPEQVSGTRSRMDKPVYVSPVKLDQTIYILPRGALRTEVISLLRFGHSNRRPRARGRDRRGKIPNMISIDQRPAEVAERQVPGYWEGITSRAKATVLKPAPLRP